MNNCNFFLCWYLLMRLWQFKNMAAEPSVCHQETFLVQVGHTDLALVHRAWPEGSVVFQEQVIPWGRRFSTNQNAELWSPVPMNTCAKTLPKLKLREHFRRRGRKIVKASGQRIRGLLWVSLSMFTYLISTRERKREKREFRTQCWPSCFYVN